MKIRVTITVDVDRNEWAEIYGVAPEDVKGDVRDYIHSAVADSAAAREGEIREVKTR